MDFFRQMVETNFFGALRCMKAMIPSMRERRQGCIINVTSVAGRVALASQAPYAASKFALEALSECLAQEGVQCAGCHDRTRRDCNANIQQGEPLAQG
jgi:NAD(P)-dependent dehydrogenase (short-subunit alcohol dehydrogenase family)